MSQNLFTDLRLFARKLDEDIPKLAETWSHPLVHVNQYADCTSETTAALEVIGNVIRDTQDQAKETLREVNRSTQNMREMLEECTKVYKDLSEQYENLASVTADYGYHYDETDDADHTKASSTIDCSQNSPENGQSVEIEFTPDLGWKCKVKARDVSTPQNNDKCASKDIKTPYEYSGYTPIKSTPQQIYSKHFYNALKK